MNFFFDKKFNKEILSIIDSYKISDNSYSITYDNKKDSYFALLFAIFLSYLSSNFDQVFPNKSKLKEKLLINLETYKKKTNIFEKPYLQLLTLTLSALYILDGSKIDFKENFINNLIDKKINVYEYLKKFKCLDGKPSSGNYAMFIAIVLIYLNDYLGVNKRKEIDQWVTLHLNNVNIFGLWGKNKNLYSYFQNGYHQYEIFKYLKLDQVPINQASNAVKNLINGDGGFAPYPGGGACYDYDAVFFLTFNDKNKNFLEKNIYKIFNNFELNYKKNLGFSENVYCRPLNLKNFYKLATHPIKHYDQNIKEIIFSTISILKNKNRVIKNHWSEKAYYWNKPNLFATWFRIMSIAKLDLNLNNNKKWKFINFPGIGF